MLERTRFVVRAEDIKTDVDALKIHRPPDEASGGNAVDIPHYVELIGDFAVHAGRRPQLTRTEGGLVIGELGIDQFARTGRWAGGAKKWGEQAEREESSRDRFHTWKFAGRPGVAGR